MESLNEFNVEEARSNLFQKVSQKKTTSSENDPVIVKESSLKKINSFLKRLKQISVEQVDSISKEAMHLNLNMHIQEMSASILENKPRSSNELFALLDVVFVVSTSVPEFFKKFISDLLKEVDEFCSQPDINDKARLVRFRWLLRTLLELNISGCCSALPKIKHVFTSLLLKNEEVSARMIGFTTYFAKNFQAQLKSGLGQLNEIFAEFFRARCRHLNRIHDEYSNCLAKGRQFYERRGDLSEAHGAELKQLQEEVDTVFKSLSALAELLGFSVPQVSASDNDFDVIDGKIVFSSNDFPKLEPASLYVDEDERKFYESLPHALEPASISQKADSENIVSDLNEIDPDKAAAIKKPTCLQTFHDKFCSVKTVEELDQVSISFVEAGITPEIENLLPEVIFELAREKNEAIPFLARFLAILSASHRSISCVDPICESLIGQFIFLIFRPQALLKTRRRICKLIGELTKFNLMSQNRAFYCFKRCVDDFSGYNIDMLCYLFEYCGRFLFYQTYSHTRMVHLIETISKKKSQSFINVERLAALNNALYWLDPSVNAKSLDHVVDEVQLFCEYVLNMYCNSEPGPEMRDIISSLPWSSTRFISALQSSLLQPWKYSFSSLHKLAEFVGVADVSCPGFAVDFIDIIIEYNLAVNEIVSWNKMQQLQSRCRMLIELFRVQLIDFSIVIQILYGFLTQKGLYAGDELWRVRLINCGLDGLARLSLSLTSAHYVLIKEFLALFRCYLSSIENIPDEIFELSQDIYDKFGCELLPLYHDVAIAAFSGFDSFRILSGKLDFLNIIKISTAPPEAALPTAKDDPAYCDELDKELSRLISSGLEYRKLEKRPARFEESVPNIQSESFPSTELKILMKRGTKKKGILKPVNVKPETID